MRFFWELVYTRYTVQSESSMLISNRATETTLKTYLPQVDSVTSVLQKGSPVKEAMC